MSSQDVKLGKPASSKRGELRIGRIVVDAAPERGAPGTPGDAKAPYRISTAGPAIWPVAKPASGPAAGPFVGTSVGIEPAEPQLNKQVNRRGYSIGVNAPPEKGPAAGKKGGNQPSVRPMTLIMFCGAVIFLVVVLLIGSGKKSRVTTGGPAFLKAYAAYLADNKEAQGSDINQRLTDVEYRLQRVVVAEETGDYQKARADLYELMLLDRDAQSPLYKRCSAWIQRLPK